MNFFKQGLLNTLEHGFSRGLDALATFTLLWFIPMEKFSLLAISQAYVAPALFLCVSPETVLYRDYGKWQKEGAANVIVRLRFLRRFAWTKFSVAMIAAVLLSSFIPSPQGTTFTYIERLMALCWAFSLALAPQIAGADREFLRLDLQLEKLNFLTILQRMIYLLLLAVAVIGFHSSIIAIGCSAVIATIIVAAVSRATVERQFRGTSLEEAKDLKFSEVIASSLRSFSLWAHIGGTITGLVQTLDLFFLGLFNFPAREIAIYSVVLKLANFALAVPVALTNLFQVHLGRRVGGAGLNSEVRERNQLLRYSLLLGGVSFLGALLLWIIAPAGLSVLSRGRWSAEEQIQMTSWLAKILPAAALFATLLLWMAWLNVRRSIQNLVFTVYIPWGIVSVIIYALSVWTGGPNSAARSNLFVMASLVPFLLRATITTPFVRDRNAPLPFA